MEVLNQKYENFKKAYEALSKVLEAQEKYKKIAAEDASLFQMHSAGVIQHFEMAYETCWKFLKQYLQELKEIDISSPKAIFRACYTNDILPLKITEELSQLSDARNKTTHIYNQILAQEVSNDIVKHQQVFAEILKLLKLQK